MFDVQQIGTVISDDTLISKQIHLLEIKKKRKKKKVGIRNISAAQLIKRLFLEQKKGHHSLL